MADIKAIEYSNKASITLLIDADSFFPHTAGPEFDEEAIGKAVGGMLNSDGNPRNEIRGLHLFR